MQRLPHDDRLIDYGASRDGRLEYVMDDVNDLSVFIENLSSYSTAADLFYMNGAPTEEQEQVLNVAHEAYGHAYFYELQ